jgi:predicted transcriptional regulator
MRSREDRVTLPRVLVYDDNLKAYDIRLFVALLDLQKNGVVENVHLATLGKMVGVTEFTIVDSLKRLVAGGFITKRRMGAFPSLLTIVGEVPSV